MAGQSKLIINPYLFDDLCHLYFKLQYSMGRTTYSDYGSLGVILGFFFENTDTFHPNWWLPVGAMSDPYVTLVVTYAAKEIVSN